MRATDWLLLIFLSILWGATFFFVAIAVKDVPPLTLVLVRVVLAALLLVPLTLLIGYKLPATFTEWRAYVLLALFNNVLPFSFLFYGQTRIASGLASVLNATTPLFTLLVIRLFAGEAIAGHKVAGIVLGVVGVAVLMGPDALQSNTTSIVGTLCILAGSLSYGFAALRMRTFQKTPPLVVASTQLICSSVILLPVAAVVDRFWTLPMPGAGAVSAVAALAVFSTALAYIVFFRINATAGPANAMLVTLLNPVTATALGMLVLSETMAPHQIAGALIVGLGLLVIDGRMLGGLARRNGG